LSQHRQERLHYHGALINVGGFRPPQPVRIFPFLALLLLLGACQPAAESRGTGLPIEFHLQTAAQRIARG